MITRKYKFYEILFPTKQDPGTEVFSNLPKISLKVRKPKTPGEGGPGFYKFDESQAGFYYPILLLCGQCFDRSIK